MSLLDRRTRIWKQNQTTNPFVCPELSFSKQKRFKLYSIYWPDKSEAKGVVKISKSAADQQAFKISKLIDEEQKNQSRMNKLSFNSSRRESSSNDKSQPKNGFSNFKPTTTLVLSKQNQRIVEKLTIASEIRQSKLRDRHGNRTNLLQNQEEQFLHTDYFKQEPKFRGTQTGFYTSRRIKLELPHNYYPGPGTYDIKRYLEEQERRMSKTTHKSSKAI